MAVNKLSQARVAVGHLLVGASPGRRLGAGTIKSDPADIELIGMFSAAVNPGTILANTVYTTNITVNGIQPNTAEPFAIPIVGVAAAQVLGDSVIVNAPAAMEASLTWSAYVSAADTLTLRIANPTAGSVVCTSRTWTFLWFKIVAP